MNDLSDVLDSLEPVRHRTRKKPTRSTTCQYAWLEDIDLYTVKVPPAVEADAGDVVTVTLRDGNTHLIELDAEVKRSNKGTRWFLPGAKEDA